MAYVFPDVPRLFHVVSTSKKHDKSWESIYLYLSIMIIYLYKLDNLKLDIYKYLSIHYI